MEGAEVVVHFAANADVRFGTDHPRKDLEQNTIATWNVLEAMREQGCKRIVFSSTDQFMASQIFFRLQRHVRFQFKLHFMERPS